ncbi:MAG TPA: DNA internalization-related competence protein ComEC/Rec2 [Steroidobacteraceae bacterium]
MDLKRLERTSLLSRALAMLCGVLLVLMSPALPSVVTLVVVLLAGVLGVVFARFRVAALSAWVCAGFLLVFVHAREYLSLRWNDASGSRVLVSATVDTIPHMSVVGWEFEVVADIEAPRKLEEPRRLRLVSRDPNVQPRAGERWKLLVTLQPPRARLNPGTMDYERQLFHDRIHALGTVVSSRLNRFVDDGHRPFTATRERITRRIEERVTDRDAAALIAALAVGATDAMSREQWRVFNVTGTTHLVAISGSHVTLFALVAMMIARWFWRICAWRLTSLPREAFAALLGLSAATGYAALAGFPVPTQRTLIMLAAWLMVRNLARVAAPSASIAIALLVVLAWDPFAVLSAGFWLSFAAMAAIIFVTQPRVVRRGRVHEALAVQGAASIALVPMTVGWFGSVSVVGPLVNVLAIPLLSWVFVPIVLLAVVTLPVLPAASDWLLQLAEHMHELGWPWLRAAADAPFALVYASPPSWWHAVITVTVILCLMPWPWRWRVVVVAGTLPLALVPQVPPPGHGAVHITILDVGRAQAAVVRTHRHVLLFGVGDSYGGRGGNVEGVIVPFLRSRGVRAVDMLVPDDPPRGDSPGTTALFAAMPVRSVLDSPLERNWMWDDVSFRARGGSLVIEAAGARVLLHGTTGTPLATADAIVLSEKAAAHASPEAIANAGARFVIVSGARLSRNGDERPGVQRWRQSGAVVLATADSGAIELVVDPGQGLLAPREERSVRQALWRP